MMKTTLAYISLGAFFGAVLLTLWKVLGGVSGTGMAVTALVIGLISLVSGVVLWRTQLRGDEHESSRQHYLRGH